MTSYWVTSNLELLFDVIANVTVVWLLVAFVSLPVRLFIGLVVWFSCGLLRSERGPAVQLVGLVPVVPAPQLLVSTSTAQLPLTHPQCVSQKAFLERTPLLLTYFHHCSPNPPVHPSQPTLASNEAYNEYLGPSPALTAPIDRRSALRARRATACDCRGVTWSRRGRPAGK